VWKNFFELKNKYPEPSKKFYCTSNIELSLQKSSSSKEIINEK
jgi:hypothetical protein